MSDPSEPSSEPSVPTAATPARLPAPAPTDPRRRWVLRVGIPLAVLVAVVLAVLGAVHVSYSDGARPGTLVEGGSPGMTGPAHRATVQLPSGALTIEIGRVSQKAPGFEETDAADGATWVPVDWQLGNGGPDLPNNVPVYQFSVVLVADGRRYDLHADQSKNAPASKYTPVATGKSVSVVVQGPGHGLRVEVGYDGVTQTLHVDSGRIDKGLAAPLYNPGGPRPVSAAADCHILSIADQRRYELSGADSCSVGEIRPLPYVGGFGWVASPRESWVLVSMDVMGNEIDPISGDRYRGGYDVRGIDYAVTVDGTRPTAEILRYRRDGLGAQHVGVLVIRASATPRTLRITLTTRASKRLDPRSLRTFRSVQTYALR